MLELVLWEALWLERRLLLLYFLYGTADVQRTLLLPVASSLAADRGGRIRS